MNRNRPPDVTLGPLAPHIAADVYRRAEQTGRPLVVVQTAPPARRPRGDYLFPLAIGLAVAIGVMGTIAAALALLEFATRAAVLISATAGPIGFGITLGLARPRR